VSEKTDDAGYAADFETVRAAENEWIAKRRAAAGLPPPSDDLIGVAFSGGGIRSATFNLGVLQGLEKSGLLRHVDYLSSVSGGGYAASCYTWLRSQLGKTPVSTSVFSTPLADGSGGVLDWLRSHGKFLVSHRGYSIWTLIASIFAATFINVLVLGPPLLLTIYAMTLDWLRVQWPEWLALPGAHPLQGHHGYWLLMVLGVACLELFPVVAIVFAFVAGIRSFSSVRRVDYLRVFMGRLIVFGLVLIAIGLIPVAALLGEMAEHFFVSRHAHTIGKHLSYLVPAITGFVSMLLDRRKSGDSSGRLTTIGLSLIVYALLILCYHVAAHIHLEHAPILSGMVVLSVVLAFVVDINRVSIHAYYRARLSETFMPSVHTEPRDPGEFRIDGISPDTGAPLQLINTTLNTTSSDNERLSSRQGASFFFSPVFAGSVPTGFRRVDSYARGAVTLSNAFTTSGAAIDPDMYVTSARAMSFLMALFNVRLGLWAHNPRFAHTRDPLLPWWWIFIAREMLGIGLDEKRRHVHLSDGGGFENLGIYELIRRRVRWLVVTDAGDDPDVTLADLGRAIERVRVDFGARVDLSADKLYHQRDDRLMQQPFVLGTIQYADGTDGRILYVRPTLCAGLSADIYAYWRANPDFPDEPTSEQFFDEPQFEAYRALGFELFARLTGPNAPPSVWSWFDTLANTPPATTP
jgi:hypothetical protein